MDRVDASAPGKLVLFGEYAVLFGAPAVVAAVDRRAVVTLAPGDRWEVSAPGLAQRAAKFDVGAGGEVRWDDEHGGRDTFSMVEKLLGTIAKRGLVAVEALPTAMLRLDSRAFFDHGENRSSKLGLGSSAALTVALVSALEMWSGSGRSASAQQRLRQLVEIHRDIQGGAGSGIDVAASLLGGVLRFQLADDGSVAEADPINLPERLQMVFLWTGRAVSTGDFLGRLREFREARRGEIDPVLDELSAVSSAGVEAIAAGSTDAFLEQVDFFWNALEKLGAAIGMPILSEEHRTLRKMAEGCGLHYKPSGAGGGDFGVGFTTDAASALSLADRASARGFRLFELRVDTKGLTGEGQ
jgi:phosphomevalonate kinase